MTPAEVERAVERTGVRSVADLRTMLAELREVYEGRDAAQRETIAALRRRAEAAEAERDELRARLDAAQAAPAASEAPTVLIVEETAIRTPRRCGGASCTAYGVDKR